MGGAIPYENGREVGSGAQKKGNKSPVVKAATELEMIIVVCKIFSFDVRFTIDGQFWSFLSCCLVLRNFNYFSFGGLKYLLEVGRGQ